MSSDPISDPVRLPGLRAARRPAHWLFLPGLLVVILRGGFDLLVVPGLGLAVAGYFGASAWLPDLANFFRPHIAVLALVLVALALLAQSPLRLAAGLVIFAIAVYPLLVSANPAAPASTVGNFRLMTANVLGYNQHTEDFRRIVAEAKPDVVIAEEAIWHWRDVMRSLPGYTHVAGSDFAQPISVLVASRYPIVAEPLAIEGAARPSPAVGGGIGMRIEVTRPEPARPLVIYAIHPPTPRTAAGWRARNLYLDQVAGFARVDAAHAEVIVAGDWNTPSWSPVFASFLRSTGLFSTERSAWPAPTRFFPDLGLPSWLGSPIDHVAVSDGIRVVSLDVGRPFGSDHLPVVTELALP